MISFSTRRYIVHVAAADSECAAPPELAPLSPEAAASGVCAEGRTGSWRERRWAGCIPVLEAGGDTTLQFALRADPAAEPGTHFLSRVELELDGLLLEHSPAVRTRVAPARPAAPADASVAGDVLFVTGPGLIPGDYHHLVALCRVLGRRAHFLDWEHFACAAGGGGDGGGSPAATDWEGLRGRSVVVFRPLPQLREDDAQAFLRDVAAHCTESGGAVLPDSLCGPQQGGFPGPQQGRRHRRVSPGGAADVEDPTAALQGGLEPRGEQVQLGASGGQQGIVKGSALASLLRALVAVLPAEGKLSLLRGGGRGAGLEEGGGAQLAVRLEAFNTAPTFEAVEVVNAGCCFCYTAKTVKIFQEQVL